MQCAQHIDQAGSTGSVSGDEKAVTPRTAAPESTREDVVRATPNDGLPEGTSTDPIRTSDSPLQEHNEFLKSLQLARKALYARDPKRRAMEAIERQAQN